MEEGRVRAKLLRHPHLNRLPSKEVEKAVKSAVRGEKFTLNHD